MKGARGPAFCDDGSFVLPLISSRAAQQAVYHMCGHILVAPIAATDHARAPQQRCALRPVTPEGVGCAHHTHMATHTLPTPRTPRRD